MAYTVNEVASQSGVSIRTLRYYDQIGLLKPAYYGSNGYRYYEQEQLTLLQHILLMRELELPLSTIKELIEHGSFNESEALVKHRELLIEKVERLQALIAKLNEMIQHPEKKQALLERSLFRGLDVRMSHHQVKELRSVYMAGRAAI
ncbi:MerR family transcriptional regulator [Paenibacillus aquistagni]|uniref:DNA-binding transcriptional regulator, MerR family n=1 Tax=Paenibacillus aquistagni TaxID=1852522 RepID=A0A1X7IMX8_9BACL|nr:MerR family transcriptional regulator [Paenibacillus aquistagni]NMM51280.1 MerR family transcriptional regulator [Paenibacillus aquistagni]SMG15736.1 DNA-binding transcriptional regulator, MerR family [Paenibacillus aquistagni]